jgi:hypothetical protein
MPVGLVAKECGRHVHHVLAIRLKLKLRAQKFRLLPRVRYLSCVLLRCCIYLCHSSRKIGDDDCHAGCVACGLEIWPPIGARVPVYRGASNQHFLVMGALIAEMSNTIPTFINIAHDRSNLQQVHLLKDPDPTV